MNTQPHLTRIAMGHFKAHAPSHVPMWKVYSCGKCCFENEDIRLCWYYKKTHNLKNATIKPIYFFLIFVMLTNIAYAKEKNFHHLKYTGQAVATPPCGKYVGKPSACAGYFFMENQFDLFNQPPVEEPEIWKDVPKTNGIYQASNFGKIKSNARYINRNGFPAFIKERFLTPGITGDYYNICLTVNGKSFTEYLHRIIAITFLPNPQNKPEVNHIDGNKLNNHLSNLEWNTKSENIRHAYDNKLMNPPFGEKHSNTSLKNEDVYDIKILLLVKHKAKVIASIFNVEPSVIHAIKQGTSWSHIQLSETVLSKYDESLYTKSPRDKYATREDDIRLKPIYMVYKNTHEIIKEYPSTRSAQSDGYHETVISRCACGRRPTAYGVKWIFKKDYKIKTHQLKTKPTLK